jgi:urease beta subunit
MLRVLPHYLGSAGKRTMTAITVPLETGKISGQSSPHRVQMDISNQLLEVNLFLAHDRLETILEKLAVPAMASVESNDITGQQLAHQAGKRDIPGSEKEVGVIG